MDVLKSRTKILFVRRKINAKKKCKIFKLSTKNLTVRVVTQRSHMAIIFRSLDDQVINTMCGGSGFKPLSVLSSSILHKA